MAISCAAERKTVRRSLHPKLICREIGEADLAAIADLLHAGFPAKPRDWFTAQLEKLAVRQPVAGCPRFGMMLDSEGRPAGAVLTLGMIVPIEAGSVTACNLACWHVRDEFRAYGTIMYQSLLRRADLTLVNVTPARWTWRVIEAQGFRQIASGIYAGVPALSAISPGVSVRAVRRDTADLEGLSPDEMGLLRDHAEFGCIALVCQSQGKAEPFVFRRRRLSRIVFPAAQLVHCRDHASLRRCAGALGRYLMRHGMAWMLVHANASLEGMAGRFLAGRQPLYARGPHPPEPTKLAYSEMAVFGF